MVDAGVVVAGLSFAAALIALSALTALSRPRTLHRQVTAVYSGKYPAWQGYARYRGVMRVGAEAYASLILLTFVALLAVLIELPQSSFDLTGFVDFVTIPANLAVLLICFLTSLYVAIVISTVIVAAVADAPAYRILRGGTLRTGELVTRRLKIFLVGRLPVLLALDVCAALYGIGVPWQICLALFLAAYIVVNVTVLRAIAPLQRWFYPCVPLERSRWAALAPRVETWARLAGQSVPHVYVRSGPTEGLGNSAALGGFPGTLYLADEFLASSEWRQQDALLCWLLVARGPLMGQVGRIAAYRTGFLLGLAGTLVASVLLLTNIASVALSGLLTIFLPILMLLALLVVFSILGRSINRRARRIFAGSDRRAAELTGDPWAVMTTLATMDTLCQGIPAPSGLSLGAVPPRLAALDALSRMPGPRAPWAYQPVPSLQPVLAGPYTITIPLGMQTPVSAGSTTIGQ